MFLSHFRFLATRHQDMSKANPAKPSGLVLTGSASKGGSAQTFRGLLAYISTHRPLVLFENVDNMEESKTDKVSNLDVLLSETGSRGD